MASELTRDDARTRDAEDTPVADGVPSTAVSGSTRPRILVDGFNMSLTKGTGVATYGRNLCASLTGAGYPVDVLYGQNMYGPKSALLEELSFYDPVNYRSGQFDRTMRALFRSVVPPVAREINLTTRIVSRQFETRLPKVSRHLNAKRVYIRAEDLYRMTGRFLEVASDMPTALANWTYPLPIRLKGARNIYTLHDLVPLRLPYTTLDNKKAYYQMVKAICRDADHLVTVSETSKRDIQDIFGVPDDKITVTYQSVTLPRKALAKTDQEAHGTIEGIFGLKPRSYYLIFGSIEPKKNVGRMIEGFLKSRSNAKLVIVGAMAWKSDEELRLYEEMKRREIEGGSGKRNPIIKLEYLSLSMLVDLIRTARGVLFASLYEGFGLPILEAMTLGTPVITSTEGSCPEIAGDAAVIVDPYDTQAIADAIRRLDTAPGLRAELAAAGRERAAVFSQARYVERLEPLYRKLTAG